jgi:site-specific DNA-methyltransferase (adenine-specific)
MENKLYLEDCRLTMKRSDLRYDYIFCGPPDFDELGWSPDTHMDEYFEFLKSIFSLFNPRKHAVTIAITDRKYDAGIIEKHAKIIAIMRSLNYKYVSQKIWKKSDKLNLYRLNYSFVMSFSNDKIKQSHNREYEYDIWDIENDKYEKYSYGFPTEMVRRSILNFTEKNDIVYDCFAGSGTSAVACVDTGRYYVGSEIDEETHKLSVKRLKELEQRLL